MRPNKTTTTQNPTKTKIKAILTDRYSKKLQKLNLGSLNLTQIVAIWKIGALS